MVAVDRKFDFEIVSPERLVLSEPVDMAVIPGSEGDFGVLAGHTLMLSTLRPGVIDVWQGEQVATRLFVAGGFAEVTETRCTVLADEAMPLDAIDAAAVSAQLESLRAELAAADSDDERRTASTQIAVAEAKLAATGRQAA
jgi:F-type H+-transporting ATPase subunit epsilon